MYTHSIQRLSKVMMAASWIGALCYPLFQIWFWFLNPRRFESLSLNRFLQNTNFSSISDAQILLAFTVSLIGALLLSYGLWRLAKMFKEFLSGHFFTPLATRHLRVFALCLLITAIYRVFQTSLLSAILTWHNAPGLRQLIFNFGSQELSTTFVAGLLFAIAWCFDAAHKIDSENKEFI